MNRRVIAAATLPSLGFVACIVLANAATTQLGMVPVGFGLTATAGTYFAGITFLLRDVIHDLAGWRVTVALILVGAVVSFVLADPRIVVASVVAFLVSELSDLAVYAPLRRRGHIRAAVASNIVGAFVDTVLFLSIAGFPVWPSVPGQVVGKLAITAVFLAGAGAFLAVRAKRAAACNIS